MIWVGNPQGKAHLRDLKVHDEIRLRWITEIRCEMDSSASGKFVCEVLYKRLEFLGQLGSYQQWGYLAAVLGLRVKWNCHTSWLADILLRGYNDRVQLNRWSDSLQAGWQCFDSHQRQKPLHLPHTQPGFWNHHTASPKETYECFFPWVKRLEHEMVTSHLVQKFRICRCSPLYPRKPSWSGVVSTNFTI
jgi:hypothetical protein